MEVEVPNFPSYKSTREGKVLSYKRGRPHEIKPWMNNHGYMMVDLYKDGKKKTVSLHKIIALCFLGPCPKGMEVCHGPKGKLDNSLENLSYGTKSDNNGRDRLRDGTMPDTKGEKHPKAKLTNDKVLEIRRLAAFWYSFEELAETFGVDITTIRRIVKRQLWRHI